MKDRQYNGQKKKEKRQTMVVNIRHGKLNIKQDKHIKNTGQLDE